MRVKKILSVILVAFLISSMFQPCVYAAKSDYDMKQNEKDAPISTPTDVGSEIEIVSPEYTEDVYYSGYDYYESILKFYSNADIDFVMDDIVSSTPLEEVIIPDNQYVNNGYTFMGWNTEPDGSGDSYKEGDIFVIPEDLSSVAFYAQWNPIRYKISFDGNTATSGIMDSINCEYGESYNLPNRTFKKKGYTFTGWNTKKDGSGIGFSNKSEVFNLTTVDSMNIILYAQWSITDYAISYVKGQTNDDNPLTYNVNTDTITLQDPTWKGHSFGGWFLDSDYTKKASSIKKGSTGDKTFYAKWTTNKYTVKYNGNGSTSGSMKDITCKYGATYSFAKNVFKRTGYRFTGWNSRKDGTGTAYKNGQEFKNLRSNDGAVANLYAQWKPNQYTVKFYSNDAEGNMDSVVYDYDKKYNLPGNEFIKGGFAFAGWNTKKDGSGTQYTDKCSVTKLSAVNGATVVLYAQWKPRRASIKEIIKVNSTTNKIVINYQTSHGYQVYRSTSKSGGYKLIGTTTSEKYTDKTASSGTTYYYKVRAYFDKDSKTRLYGSFSSVVSVTFTTQRKEDALNEAKGLLKSSAYSYSDLKEDLLEFYDYTATEVKYALDNCGADWNEQAVRQAKEELNYNSYSHKGIKQHLIEFYSYTKSQAQYGADKCGANWNQQAVKRAKTELKQDSFSSKELRAYLETEFGFTSEQAKYGIDNCGASWKQQAAKRASEELKHKPYSYSGMIEYLESEHYFTSTQAQYGADNCYADWDVQALKKAKEYRKNKNYSTDELIELLMDDGFTRSQAEYGERNTR